jgi:hypothetical protein
MSPGLLNRVSWLGYRLALTASERIQSAHGEHCSCRVPPLSRDTFTQASSQPVAKVRCQRPAATRRRSTLRLFRRAVLSCGTSCDAPANCADYLLLRCVGRPSAILRRSLGYDAKHEGASDRSPTAARPTKTAGRPRRSQVSFGLKLPQSCLKNIPGPIEPRASDGTVGGGGVWIAVGREAMVYLLKSGQHNSLKPCSLMGWPLAAAARPGYFFRTFSPTPRIISGRMASEPGIPSMAT